jgi:hypothetical protein
LPETAKACINIVGNLSVLFQQNSKIKLASSSFVLSITEDGRLKGFKWESLGISVENRDKTVLRSNVVKHRAMAFIHSLCSLTALQSVQLREMLSVL